MKKIIGPYLSRIETPYLMREELRRTRERLRTVEQELARERAAKTELKPPKAERTGGFSAPKTRGAAEPTPEEAKTYFRAKVRAQYAGAAQPTAPAGEQTLYKTLLQQAEQSEAEAQYLIGECSLHGWGTMQFNAHAVQWLRRAAQQGSNDAAFRLGLCLIDGKGASKDEKEGRQWIEKAAAGGLAEASRWVRENPTPAKMKLFSGGKSHAGKKKT